MKCWIISASKFLATRCSTACSKLIPSQSSVRRRWKVEKQSVASICLMIRNFQQSTRLFACMNSCAHSNTDVCGRTHSGDVKLVAACNWISTINIRALSPCVWYITLPRCWQLDLLVCCCTARYPRCSDMCIATIKIYRFFPISFPIFIALLSISRQRALCMKSLLFSWKKYGSRTEKKVLERERGKKHWKLNCKTLIKISFWTRRSHIYFSCALSPGCSSNFVNNFI